MISVTELRAGTIFEDKGNIYQVISYEHVKMGRGSANIKVKVKNLKTGSTTEKSFINGAKVKPVSVFKKDFQYLYKDDDLLFFMDPKSFEQISVPIKIAQGCTFLREGENFNLSFLGNEALSLNLPPKMEFKVEETGPGIRGNSATNIFKDAILENGFKTRVPLFINIGDKIRIDTRTGTYSEKA